MPATYPYNPTGAGAPENWVNDEVHTMTSINATQYHVLVPYYAPFHLADPADVELIYVAPGGSETTLVFGVDYQYCLKYMAATRGLSRAVYGGVYLTNPALTGSVKFSYKPVGGDWSANQNYVLNVLVTMAYNPREVTWDQVTNVQDTFPPGPHPHPPEDVNWSSLIDKVNLIYDAITANAGPTSALATHLLDNAAHGRPEMATSGEILAAINAANSNVPVATNKLVTLAQVVSVMKQFTGWLPVQKGVTVFANDTDLGTVTGTTVEQILATYTIPAALIGPKSAIRVVCVWSSNNNANTKQARMYLGGTQFLNYPLDNGASVQTQTVIRNRNSVSSQVSHAGTSIGYSKVGSVVNYNNVNLGVDQTLQIGAVLSNAADTVTLAGVLIEILNP